MLNIITKIESFFKKKEKKDIGFSGEDEAVTFLKKKHYILLERNVRNKYGYSLGEIDVIAKKGKELVFFEVKTRVYKDKEILPPEMSITKQKIRKLEKIIFQYRASHIQYKKWPFRLDAVIVVYDKDNKVKYVQHKENIFLD